jgi:tetratricopeptide (TPR) repeat protein
VLEGSGDHAKLGIPTGSLVSGSVTASTGTIHIRAAWRRAQDRFPIAEATVEGGKDQLSSLLDQLVIQLLAQAQIGPRHALARTATLSTGSLPAVKSFLSGERAFGEGRFSAAAQAFEHATVLDSTFALAQYRLGVSALWSEDYPLAAADAGTRALRHSATLSDRDRRLLRGFDGWRRGDRDSASSHFLSILASDHDNLEAWFQLGETLFHYNPSWGLPIAEARDAFRQVIRLDPDHWGALWHLAMLDAIEGRTSELDRHLDHLLQLGPQTDYVLEIGALRACAHRDPAARGKLLDALRTVGEGRLFDMAWRCAVYGRDLDGAELMGRVLLERHTMRWAEVQGRYLLAHIAMARGWRSRAYAQLDSLATLSPGMTLNGKTDFSLLPEVGASPQQLEELAQAWHNWRDRSKDLDFSYPLGRIEAARGRHDLAESLASQIETAPEEGGSLGLSHAKAQDVRATLAAHDGNPTRGLHWLEEPPPVVWFGVMVSSPSASRAPARFHLAEALASAGRLQEAQRWYASLSELSLYDLSYAPFAHLRRAELALRLADTAASAEQYARFLELWKDADPELQPLVAAARERLTRLSAHR